MGTKHDMIHVHEKGFSDVGGWPALDFVNTVSGYITGPFTDDLFEQYTDLVAWAKKHELLGETEVDRLLLNASRHTVKAKEALERARALRMAIYRVFTDIAAERAPDQTALDAVNAELAVAMENARIEPHGEEGFVWGWRNPRGELESVLWPIAKSAADLLVSHKLDRVRSCQSETCGWLFLDLSKNRSRRWCSMSDCGNTAKARRHYQRKVKGMEEYE